MQNPLVTVICLCYNHEKYIAESVLSVLGQSYSPLQIIIVDDHSTDGSRAVIVQLLAAHTGLLYLPLARNVGNCAAFNQGLSLAKGEFVIDLATDDVLHVDRIAKQVAAFQALTPQYGVVYTDAHFIDNEGNTIDSHKAQLERMGFREPMPEGNVFAALLRRYTIAAPTMMIRTSVIKALGGYDEQLAFEDFDFWVRSSSVCWYKYLDEPLTLIRKLPTSMSAHIGKKGDRQLHSTYLVCEKAKALAKSAIEKDALIARVAYHTRNAVFTGNMAEAQLFWQLLKSIQGPSLRYALLLWGGRMGIPFRALYQYYLALRHG